MEKLKNVQVPEIEPEQVPEQIHEQEQQELSDYLKNLDRETKSSLKRLELNATTFTVILKHLIAINKILIVLKKFMINQGQIKELSERDKAKKEIERNRIDFTELPDRIWFSFNGLCYYIDFGFQIDKKDKRAIPLGQIIYGTSYYKEQDKVIDKVLIIFSIDESGVIIPSSFFEDETWTIEKEDILDLHIRTLDKIWPEALLLLNKENQ